MELFFNVAATIFGFVSVFCFYKAWRILIAVNIIDKNLQPKDGQ